MSFTLDNLDQLTDLDLLDMASIESLFANLNTTTSAVLESAKQAISKSVDTDVLKDFGKIVLDVKESVEKSKATLPEEFETLEQFEKFLDEQESLKAQLDAKKAEIEQANMKISSLKKAFVLNSKAILVKNNKIAKLNEKAKALEADRDKIEEDLKKATPFLKDTLSYIKSISSSKASELATRAEKIFGTEKPHDLKGEVAAENSRAFELSADLEKLGAINKDMSVKLDEASATEIELDDKVKELEDAIKGGSDKLSNAKNLTKDFFSAPIGATNESLAKELAEKLLKDGKVEVSIDRLATEAKSGTTETSEAAEAAEASTPIASPTPAPAATEVKAKILPNNIAKKMLEVIYGFKPLYETKELIVNYGFVEKGEDGKYVENHKSYESIEFDELDMIQVEDGMDPDKILEKIDDIKQASSQIRLKKAMNGETKEDYARDFCSKDDQDGLFECYLAHEFQDAFKENFPKLTTLANAVGNVAEFLRENVASKEELASFIADYCAGKYKLTNSKYSLTPVYKQYCDGSEFKGFDSIEASNALIKEVYPEEIAL